jgi:hypothetical protein
VSGERSSASPARQEQPGAKVSADDWQRAKTMKRRCRVEIVREISDLHLAKATGRKQFSVAFRIPYRNMTLDLPENTPGSQTLHEVLVIGRVQIKLSAGLQRTVYAAKNREELVVVDVLREIEREGRVESRRMARTEGNDIVTVKSAVLDATRTPPSLRRGDEFPRKIDTNVLADAGSDQLEQDSIAAPEIRNRFAAGEIDERKQPTHARDRMRIVLIHIALAVDGAQGVIGQPSDCVS